MYWSCGKRLNLEDLLSVKFTEVGNQESRKVKQEHWNYAATLCTNSWRTKNKQLKYYRLKEIAKCPEERPEDSKILKSKATDFDLGFICSAHWSKGERENIDYLPDLPCAPEFVEKKATKKTTPVRKIESAERCSQQQSKTSEAKKRRVLSYSGRDEPSNSDILKKE